MQIPAGRTSVFFTIFLITVFSLTAGAQKRIPPEKPRLVIGLIIEQMNSDELYRYWDKLDDNGFKRLVNEGGNYKNAEYDYLLTGTAAGAATIATGCNPQVHGIVSDSWYDPTMNKIVNCCETGNYQPVGSSPAIKSYSPANLVSKTTGDEMKLSGRNKSRVISISLFPETSVILGGHAADEVWWFDFSTGCWISNTYYMENIPSWAAGFNRKNLPSLYLNKEWKSLLPLAAYTESIESDHSPCKEDPAYFTCSFRKNEAKVTSYESLAVTPFGNNLVKDFALETIVSETLGKDNDPDILYINFSSPGLISRKYGELSAEKEDAFLRLDKEIAHFLQFLDEQVGKENLVLFLTSMHGSPVDAKLISSNKIPAGTFDPDRAMILLKAYLNAVYHPGDWVKKYFNRQLFLNQIQIEDSKISLADFEEEAARFMSQFSGISAAIPSRRIFNGLSGISGLMAVQSNYYSKRCGDIFLLLEPGCSEVNDMPEEISTVDCPSVPLIWYGWKLNRVTVSRHVSQTSIAPTISNFLNIRKPDGCTSDPLPELTE